MSDSDVIQSASPVRTADGGEREMPWAEMQASAVVMARPWRTFRWYKGQRHIRGFTGPVPSALRHLRIEVGTDAAALRQTSIRRFNGSSLSPSCSRCPSTALGDAISPTICCSPTQDRWSSTSNRVSYWIRRRWPSRWRGRERWSSPAGGGSRSGASHRRFV